MKAEIDIEYDNGWRETVTIEADKSEFRVPFNGKVIGFRPIAIEVPPSCEITGITWT
jgi:hypothetical protein